MQPETIRSLTPIAFGVSALIMMAIACFSKLDPGQFNGVSQLASTFIGAAGGAATQSSKNQVDRAEKVVQE